MSGVAADVPGRREGLLRRFLPRGLFPRSLIIIVAPVVLLQLVVTYLFFERHFEVTTTRLCRSMAANIAVIVRLHDRFDDRLDLDEMAETISASLGMTVGFLPGERIPQTPSTAGGTLNATLARELAGPVVYPFWFDTARADGYVDIRVGLPEGVLRVLAERKFVVATNTHIFLGYMVAASFVLITIAVLFLRNQIRPIQRLAAVAEAFGKGRDMPDYRPAGATEVRAAGAAFLDMRERINRHLQQRTDMLAGVSHDLRTPLTRMKLQLAMMGDDPDIEAMRHDMREMEHMLEDYLAFARGTGGEPAAETDLSALVAGIVEDARRQANGAAALSADIAEGLKAQVRARALKRAVGNLIDNALQFGRSVRVALGADAAMLYVTVEDDGPGIPPELREAAFRPFVRLDPGRNLDRAGVGLGLAIARDIARSHGGDVALSESVLGGLRAELRIPV